MTTLAALASVELAKQARRPKTWGTLAVMAAIPVLLTVVIGVWAPDTPERIGNWISVRTEVSGLAMPLVALNAMVLFLLPLGVALFAAETVAGDRSWGSLRYLLARPVTRARILCSKTVVAAGWSVATVLVAVAVSTVAGLAAFGWEPLTTLDLQHTTAFHLASGIDTPWAALGHVVTAGGIICLSLLSTFAFTVLLSTLTSRPFSAMAGGVGFTFASRALDNVPGLHALGQWLPATDGQATVWAGLFGHPAQLSGLAHLGVVQLIYAVAFLVGAWVVFTRTDALS